MAEKTWKILLVNSSFLERFDLMVHKTGDHLLLGTGDAKLLWFDLDSGQHPYKKMKVHNGGVTTVAYGKMNNLLASACVNGQVVIQHAYVDVESFGFPTITPVKVFNNRVNEVEKEISQIKFLNSKTYLAGIGSEGECLLWA